MLPSLVIYAVRAKRLAIRVAVLLAIALPMGGCGGDEVESPPAVDAEQARQNHIESMQRESGKGEAPQY